MVSNRLVRTEIVCISNYGLSNLHAYTKLNRSFTYHVHNGRYSCAVLVNMYKHDAAHTITYTYLLDLHGILPCLDGSATPLLIDCYGVW